jgi:enterochelin esterase-like enzyme
VAETVYVVLRKLSCAGVSVLICSACALAEAPAKAKPASIDVTFQLTEISPRIAALKQRLDSGDDRALAEFWQEVARTSTPLIELARDKPHEVIVTFLWRGADKNTRSVGLLAPLQKAPGMPNFPLRQLLDTDVWYLCWELRDDLRFTYRFALNVAPGERYSEGNAKLDPLNPHTIAVSYDDGATIMKFSIAAMPQALDESWIVKRPTVPAGTVEPYQLKSAILGNERRVWVYSPPGYKEKARSEYWLLVLFDGFFYQDSIPTATILDSLIQAGKVPPMVVVVIDNPPASRVSDLAYNPAWIEFLAKEVLPWTRAHWSVTTDPGKSIVGGLSMGGSAAAYVAMHRPDLFGNVLSQSGAFADGNGPAIKWGWLATQYQAAPKLPLRFFIEEGILEDVSRDGPTGLAANRQFVEVLKSKGYSVTYEEVGGSHEPVHWRGALAKGLVALAGTSKKAEYDFVDVRETSS